VNERVISKYIQDFNTKVMEQMERLYSMRHKTINANQTLTNVVTDVVQIM